jgi:hypothetical protein
MRVRLQFAGVGITLALSLLLLACESEEAPKSSPTDTYIGTEQIPLGTYSRNSDGDGLMIQFRNKPLGTYLMLANGQPRREGTFTLGHGKEVLFDDRLKQDICPNSLGFGKYSWDLKGDKLSFKEVAEVTSLDGTTQRGDLCDGRRQDLTGGDWVFQQGSAP